MSFEKKSPYQIEQEKKLKALIERPEHKNAHYHGYIRNLLEGALPLAGDLETRVELLKNHISTYKIEIIDYYADLDRSTKSFFDEVTDKRINKNKPKTAVYLDSTTLLAEEIATSLYKSCKGYIDVFEELKQLKINAGGKQ